MSTAQARTAGSDAGFQAAYTVRVPGSVARDIENFRQSITPIPPSSTALLRHLIELGLKTARKNADTQAVA